MNPDRQRRTPPAPLPLTQRRAALLSVCALQREALGEHARQLRALLSPASLGAAVGRARLPLLLGAGALGLVMWKRRKVLPLLTAGMSLWKSVRTALPVLRTLLQRARR